MSGGIFAPAIEYNPHNKTYYMITTNVGGGNFFVKTQDPFGSWWAIFLACRPIDNSFENLGRETFLMPVRWSEDGFPYITQGNEVIPMIVKRDGVNRADTVTFGNFTHLETFDATTLGMEWLTLRTPGNDLYSLTDAPGYLTLHCSEINATEKKTPAFVSRRMQHHKFECSTQLLFDPEDAKHAAGLLLFKDETHQYFLGVNQPGQQKSVFLNRVGWKVPTPWPPVVSIM